MHLAVSLMYLCRCVVFRLQKICLASCVPAAETRDSMVGRFGLCSSCWNAGGSIVGDAFGQSMLVTSQVWLEITSAAAGAMGVFGTMTWRIRYAPLEVRRVASAAVASLLRSWKSTCSLREPVSSRTLRLSRVTRWIKVLSQLSVLLAG